ncbi:hypothetical protein GGR54DRAFT_625325 [Hypoxylon sp. NC1633]|nr:hypothetical protein GGR54DRAFT_625325 [Hypoxylon sp. NC1633]
MVAHGIRASWDALPCEIQTMIIEGMEPQEFRRAWFTCRKVSHTFKSATENAFKTRVVCKTSLFMGLVVNSIRSSKPGLKDYDSGSHVVPYPLEFSRFSERGTHASFRQTDDPGAGDSSFFIGSHSVPVRFLRFSVGDRHVPYSQLGKAKAREVLVPYLNRASDQISPPQGPYLIHSGAVFVLPYMDHVDVDFETVELSIPWQSVIGAIMTQEVAIVDELTRLASEDLEETQRHFATSPSAEQGLRINLGSEVVRYRRFKESFDRAVRTIRGRSSRHRIVDHDWWIWGTKQMSEEEIEPWYKEWTSYIDI